jgi:hypothetical protein
MEYLYDIKKLIKDEDCNRKYEKWFIEIGEKDTFI